MARFEDVVKEFQKKRIEKEFHSAKIKEARMTHLFEMAELADQQMRKRKRRKTS